MVKMEYFLYLLETRGTCFPSTGLSLELVFLGLTSPTGAVIETVHWYIQITKSIS